MAITIAQTKTGVNLYAASYALAFDSNVTAGGVIVFGLSSKLYTPRDFVAGDLTKTAGTATIGTISLEITGNDGGATPEQYSAVYTVPVTGTGSLTLQIANGDSNSTFRIHMLEATSANTSGTRIEDTDHITGSSTPTSGAMTAAGGSLFFGACSVFDGGATFTGTGGFTSFGTQTGEGAGAAAYQIFTSGTTDSVEWSSPTGTPFTLSSIVLKEAATATGGTHLKFNLLGVG